MKKSSSKGKGSKPKLKKYGKSIPKFETAGVKTTDPWHVNTSGDSAATRSPYNAAPVASAADQQAIDASSKGGNNGPSARQYSTAATGLVQGGTQAYMASQDPGLNSMQKTRGIQNGVDTAEIGVATAINPFLGTAAGLVKKGGAAAQGYLDKIDSQGNISKPGMSKAGEVVGGVLDPAQSLTAIFTDPKATTGQKVAGALTGGYSDMFTNRHKNQVESSAKADIAAQAEQQKQQDAYNQQVQQNQNQQNEMYNYFKNQQGVQTARNGGIFRRGGMYASGGEANAQLENSEMYNIPGGPIGSVDSSSHEEQKSQQNPDGNVNIPNGTQMLPDHKGNSGLNLKINKMLVNQFPKLFTKKDIGKTFSDVNSRLETPVQDKIVADPNSTSDAKSTAQLKIDTKKFVYNKNMEALDFLTKYKQEQSRSKVAEYAAKLGVDINSLQQRSRDDESQEPGGMTEQSEGEYRNGGVKKYWTGGTNNESLRNPAPLNMRNQAAPLDFNNPYLNQNKLDLNPNDVNEGDSYFNPKQKQNLKPFSLDRSQDQYLGNNDNSYQPNRQVQDPESSSMINEYRPSNPELYRTKKNVSDFIAGDKGKYNEKVGQAANMIGQNVGNIADLWMTRFGKKYDKEDSGQLHSKLLSDTEALRDADIEYNATRKSLKDMTSGNVNQQLSNLGSAQTQNTLNKAKIREQYQNTNAGIENADLYHNQGTRIADRIAEQGNKARSEDIARTALRGIGQNTIAANTDFRKAKMDQYSLELISKAYPDYEYDATRKGWYHKKTGEKLTSK